MRSYASLVQAATRRSAVVLSLLALSSAGFVRAQPSEPVPYVWRNVVIGGGGFVTGLVYHPAARNLLYARTDVGGAYRWDSPRERWIPLNEDIGRESSDLHGVLSIGLDPNDPSRVYLACGSYTNNWAAAAALLASDDRGATWRRYPLPFKLGGNENGRSTGERLQIDPRDGAVLYLGTTRNGLWRSRDRGVTWSQVQNFPAERVTWVAFAPARAANSQEIFAGAGDTTQPAVYRSADNGATWMALRGQPSGLVAHHAAFDAGGTLYVAYANGLGPNDVTNGAVWKYERAKERWTNITPLAPNADAKDTFGYAGIDLDRTRPGTIVVSTLDRWKFRDEIFRSTDSGATWTPLLAPATWDERGYAYVKLMKPHWIGSVAVDPFDGTRAWFITGYGVWGTSNLNAPDNGAKPRWSFAEDGLEETVIDELASPPAGAPLLSAVGDLGGFRHDALDRSPATGMFQPFYGSGASIAFARAQPAIVLRTHHGPARGAISRDGGSTWADFASAPPPAVANGPGAVAIGSDARSIVWLPKGSGAYYSTDGGASWRPSTGEFISGRDYAIDRPTADSVAPNVFYYYDFRHGRLQVSHDGGATFALASLVPLRGGMLQSQPGTAGWVWLPTGAGLFVSKDSGHSFARVPGIEAAYQLAFGCPAREGDPPTIFAAARIHGRSSLYRSVDLGQTWRAIGGEGRDFGWIRTLAADARVFDRVYVGTSGRGILYGDSSEGAVEPAKIAR